MASLFESQFNNQRPLLGSTSVTRGAGGRIGIREELSDLIANVDAKDTPITSMAKRGSKPGNTTFRWQVDRNPDPSIELGILDGSDVDPTNPNTNAAFKQYTIGYREEVENNIHMFRRAVHVSNLTQDILNVAGVKDELSRQLAKATIDLKRSMELTFTSDILPAIDDGLIPYRTRCLTAWIKGDLLGASTNAQTKYGIGTGFNAAQNIRSIGENFRTPTSSIIGTGQTVDQLGENDVQDVMTSVYEQTGQFKNHEAVVGTALKRQFTNLVYTKTEPAFTSKINVNRDANSDIIKASVDYFEGDFGKLALVPSQFLHAGVNPYTIVDCGTGASGASYTATGRFAVVDGVYAATDVTSNGAGLNLINKNLVWLKDATTNKYERVAFNTASAVPARFATETEAKVYVNLHANNAKCKGFIIPWDMLEIRYGGNIAQVRELTENGGGPRRMMEAMAALVVNSPLTFGMFDYRASTANGGLLT
jgi:hypothetical protein